MNKCTSWLGHRYSPRYDEEPNANALDGISEGSAAGLVRIIEAMTKVTYVHDICVRCGHIVKRDY